MRTTMAACGSALMLALLVSAGCDSARDERASSATTNGERVAMAKGAGEDAAIASEVERKLGADQQTSALEIEVRTDEGVVTLSGKVKNEAEKDRAEALAEDVEGVKRVDNNLVIARAPSGLLDLVADSR